MRTLWFIIYNVIGVPVLWIIFIIYSVFNSKVKEGFKKIGLINGSQLVDILIDNYDDLPQELKDKLGFRKILVSLLE